MKVCLHSIWRIFLQFLIFQILEVFHRKLVRTACMQKGGKTKNLLLLYNCVCLFVHFAKARKRGQTWLSFRSQVKITNMLVELCFASAHTKESENHRVGLLEGEKEEFCTKWQWRQRRAKHPCRNHLSPPKEKTWKVRKYGLYYIWNFS